jgi:hypothetical protein
LSEKIYYRADERAFKPGEIMPPRSHDYITSLDAGKLAVENLIRASVPDGENMRRNSVHVFDDKDVAYNYWLPHKGRHLYKLEIDDDDILYSADLELYNQAADRFPDAAAMKAIVDQYLANGRSDTPKIEHMAKTALVKCILGRAGEQVAKFREKHFGPRVTYDLHAALRGEPEDQ